MNLDDKRKVKIGIGIAAFAVLLYLGLQNMDVVARTVRFMLGLFSPFIVGVCIAFVLNLLMNFLEKHVFFFLNRRKLPKWEKIRRPVSIVLTLVIFLGLMALLIYFLIPMLRESVMTLWGNLPGYAANLERWANRFLAPFNLSADLAETLSQFVYQFSDSILKYLTESMPKIFETATNIASGIFNAITGFIISVYFLAGKEKLVRSCGSQEGSGGAAAVFPVCGQKETGSGSVQGSAADQHGSGRNLMAGPEGRVLRGRPRRRSHPSGQPGRRFKTFLEPVKSVYL